MKDLLSLFNQHKTKQDSQASVDDLPKEVVLYMKLRKRLKLYANTSHQQNRSPYRLVSFLMKLMLRNFRKMLKLTFKHLYLLFETERVKIITLNATSFIENPQAHTIYKIKEEVNFFSQKPCISIILSLEEDHSHHFKEAIHSILEQHYTNWELCIAVCGKLQSKVQGFLETQQKKDLRIKIAYLNNNCSMAASSNAAVALATGEYLALLSSNDILSSDALYEIARKINLHSKCDFIYADEKPRNENEAFYKPDWCPDSFLSRNYIGCFAVIKRELVNQIGGFHADYEDVLHYDLYLRLTELTSSIFHIPKIIYHKRSDRRVRKTSINDAGLQALKAAITRRGLNAHAEQLLHAPNCYTVRFKPHPHKISIIIPTKDQTQVLKTCLDSIYTKTTYKNFEVIVVSNNSTEQSLFSLLENYKNNHGNFHYYESNQPFNYSKLMNEAVSRVTSEFLLFLNNDMELISSDWLQDMLGQAERPSIGAVGVKLLYFNNTIQHAGIVMGSKNGLTSHTFIGDPQNIPRHFHQVDTINNYSAVTAACLMCRKTVFNEVNGFDESLQITFNDVDFCLKLIERGYYNIYLPHVELYHYESLTRGSHFKTASTIKQHSIEIEIMRARWSNYLDYDPCYSMHLDHSGNFQICGDSASH